MSEGSNQRTSFPRIDLLKGVSFEIAKLLDDPTVSSEYLADKLAGKGFPVGASTIRTYRRNMIAEDATTSGGSGGVDRTVLNASKILCFDIETLPAEGWFYHPKITYLPWKHITKPGDMLSWSAGWYHKPGETEYLDRVQHGYDEMLQGLWNLLDEASYVIGWNSDRFDLKKVRGYFAKAGLPPFRPPKSIDLMKTARTFGFESASLGYTAKMFGVTEKIDNGAVASWQDALAGDLEALERLEVYNRGDVLTTIELFDAMRPWIPNHPHLGFAAGDEERCPRCGSTDLTDVGVHQAVVIRYRMARCGSCQGLCRSTFHSRAAVTRAV